MHIRLRFTLSLFVILMSGWATFSPPASADGLGDNNPDKVRRVPTLGIELSAEQAAHIDRRIAEVDAAIATIVSDPRASEVQVVRRAVWSAKQYQEFFDAGDLKIADELADYAVRRAGEIKASQPDDPIKPGLKVFGYVSKIDGSVQSYGLVIPESYAARPEQKFRLDIWFHGRGETLSELRFIDQRLKQVGPIAPADTIVLHPYGRYCNANKFAGEVDVLEALADVQRRMRIDHNRIAVRGFSMGGAACWQFAVHYADRWFAANPGAGFSETPEFLKHFQKEELRPTWFEEKLWHWYDCDDYAVNLVHCPTIAYSGENDIQKQAADLMEAALAHEGIDLVHIIGPKTGHSIHPDAAAEIERRLHALARTGRDLGRDVREVHLQTYTLKYNRMHWLTIDALGEHWSRARVDAYARDNSLHIAAENVTTLTIDMPPGDCHIRPLARPSVTINDQKLENLPVKSDRSLRVQLVLEGDAWKLREALADNDKRALRKRHNLQGPIDDAFMDSFVFVRPTRKAASDDVDAWAKSELERAIIQWRQTFHGEARVKDDTAITDADIALHNLVLFGDARSNAVYAKIADKLPIAWSESQITAGERKFDAKHHALIAIYPNPLNPQRYVVLNSGSTFREYAQLNNARQVPMLPDWAIVDLRTPPGSQWPGKIADADFFGEKWELLEPAAKRLASQAID